MNHGTFLYQKEIVIPSQHSEAIFYCSINKHAKPETNHIDTPTGPQYLIQSSLTKLLAVFSFSCIEQRIFDLFSFKQVFTTHHQYLGSTTLEEEEFMQCYFLIPHSL